ncbi:MAG TPA: hypothetical protein VLA89_08740 [Gemmatimonadales bacterium]|nr:hypothetical protein [Gemmatimonadales bacterium]
MTDQSEARGEAFVTPEEYGLRAAKRQLKKDNASLVEQNLALRSKLSVLAAQLEAAQKAIAQLEADVEHRDEIIQRLRSGKAA